MGLDMHMFAISKLNKKEAKKYNNLTVEELDEIPNLSFIRKSNADDEDPEEIKQIKPYLTEITVIDSLINMKKIREDYGIPDDADITGECYSSDEISYTFRNRTDFHKEVTFKGDELDKYIIHPKSQVYAFHKHEVKYWRKYYDLQEFIYDILERDNHITVANCGYYPLTNEQLDEIDDFIVKNSKTTFEVDDDEWNPYTVDARNTDTETIVYWEWY